MSVLVSRYKSIPSVSDVKKVATKAGKFAGKVAEGVKTVGSLGLAVATEPFTNKLLKQSMQMTDKDLASKNAKQKEQMPGVTFRYPIKK